jgi:hypothetical protein
MALHTLDNDGNLGWLCPNCQRDNSAHISDAGVQHTSEEMVALPPCACGRQTHLVVRPDMPNIAPESIDIASRHMQLAQILSAAGKGPETLNRPLPEPMIPLSQIEDIVKQLLAQRSDDTSPRLQSVGSPAVTLDADGTANWTCPACKTPQSRSIRNGQFAWADAGTISMPVCSACGNRPQLAASQYSELSNVLKAIGKVPQ